MGIAIVVDGVNFENKDYGKVTFEETDTKSIHIKTLNVDKAYVQFCIKATPLTGNKDVTWSVIEGGTKATIDQQGKLTLGANTYLDKVKVKAVLDADSSITDEVTLLVTHEYDDDHVIEFEDEDVETLLKTVYNKTELTVGWARNLTSSWGNNFRNHSNLDNFKEFRFFEKMTSAQINSDTGMKSLYIPPTFTSISDGRIKALTALTDLKLANVTTLDNAFANCTSLQYVDLSKVTYLKDAFYNCTALKEVILSKNTTYVKDCFYSNSAMSKIIVEEGGTSNLKFLCSVSGCAGFRLLDLPSNTTELASTMFGGNTRFSVVFICRATTPPTGFTAFSNIPSAIYVPDDSVETYKTTTGWSDAASKIYPLSTYTPA